MLQKAYFTTKPNKVMFENHEQGNKVWLRNNIKKCTNEDGDVFYECDEVYFETGATQEEITNNFNQYFSYGTSWEKPKEPTIEERLSAIEEATLYLVNSLTEVTSLGGNGNE